MENTTCNATPTFDSVWAMMQETDRFIRENARIQKKNERILNKKFAEANRRMQENERILNEKFAETDRKIQETGRQMQETDRRMRAIQKEMGSWANNHGSFAEEYFFNSFEDGEKNFFGERFERIKKNLPTERQNIEIEDEYDIVMYNCTSIAIIEVKFRAHEDHIPKLIRKAETFKIAFPHYADYNIYLGLASLSFHPGVEEACITQGIAVIKQVGEAVVINDENLRIW